MADNARFELRCSSVSDLEAVVDLINRAWPLTPTGSAGEYTANIGSGFGETPVPAPGYTLPEQNVSVMLRRNGERLVNVTQVGSYLKQYANSSDSRSTMAGFEFRIPGTA